MQNGVTLLLQCKNATLENNRQTDKVQSGSKRVSSVCLGERLPIGTTSLMGLDPMWVPRISWMTQTEPSNPSLFRPHIWLEGLRAPREI